MGLVEKKKVGSSFGSKKGLNIGLRITQPVPAANKYTPQQCWAFVGSEL